jgi:hypothetical protein
MDVLIGTVIVVAGLALAALARRRYTNRPEHWHCSCPRHEDHTLCGKDDYYHCPCQPWRESDEGVEVL